MTDAEGRVLLIHGVNYVAKTPGMTPATAGFSDDDATWIAANGFDVVRLGTTAASIMPTPGVIDTAYVNSFAQTVHMLTAHGLLVLVDLHQDGWGPTLGNDGFPDWMTVTNGATNTHTDFPLYYVTNPAIQAAFQSFWDNADATNGQPLQNETATMWKALAGAVGSDPGVLGYDLLNEPWPGTTWQACLSAQGCPTQDGAMDAYNARMAGAIRNEDPSHLLFGEPYVLFNFGEGPTTISLPGGDPASGLSWHMYTADPSKEPAVIDFAKKWSNATGGALLNSEFGAVSNPADINRMTGELDKALVPWIWWAYNEEIIKDLHQAPTGSNLHDPATVGAIVQPHPVAVAGTPESLDYNPGSKDLAFSFATKRVAGGTFPDGTVTSFQMPAMTYPDGYQVDVNGGHVTSEPGDPHLTVVADAGATCVSVATAPVGAAAPHAASDGCGTSTPAPNPTTPTPAAANTAAPAEAVRAQPTFTG